jgi:hypothetical protein
LPPINVPLLFRNLPSKLAPWACRSKTSTSPIRSRETQSLWRNALKLSQIQTLMSLILIRATNLWLPLVNHHHCFFSYLLNTSLPFFIIHFCWSSFLSLHFFLN